MTTSHPHRTRTSVALICIALTLTLSAHVSGEPVVATVSDLDGHAFARADQGALRRLESGSSVFARDLLLTSRDSSLEVKFTDQTVMSLGENTKINIDDYHFAKNEQSAQKESRFTTSILQGVVRSLTGAIAKRRPRRVSFRTKVATIGIRGTHFSAEVEGDSATIILLAMEDTSQSNAIEVANQHGKVEIDKAGWGTVVPNASSPPSPPRRMQPTHQMNRVIRSIQTTRRVRVPTPGRR